MIERYVEEMPFGMKNTDYDAVVPTTPMNQVYTASLSRLGVLSTAEIEAVHSAYTEYDSALHGTALLGNESDTNSPSVVIKVESLDTLAGIFSALRPSIGEAIRALGATNTGQSTQ